MGIGAVDVEVGLLGRFEVRIAGRAVDVPPGQQRTLLAALALQAGSAVQVGTLIDYLWDEDLPADPRAGVQNNVQRLRRSLGSEAIITVADGYALDAEPSRVDAGRFLALADRIAAEPGRRDLIDQALGLWRGEPFSDVGSPALERSWLPTLTERRLAALEARADHEIDHGRPKAAVADLRDLVGRYPLREPLWLRLITALHRSGRLAEALQAYEELRVVLADELGTDPSPELRQLHQRLLTATEAATRPATPATGADTAPAADAPRELPAQPRHLTGRTHELAMVVDLLTGESASPQVIGIHGAGGVGKSALAITAAHRVGSTFHDGQLYLDLAGATPGRTPLEPRDALTRLLYSLGVDQIPPDPDAAAARYRSELDGKRFLVVLDNALDEAQVRPLLPGNPACGVLITSRRALTGLHQAAHRQLDVLSEDRAHVLLRKLIGPDRTDAEPEAVQDIARLCGRLPLSLRIAAARITSRPTWTLVSFAERLTDTSQRLRLLRAGQLDLAAAFEVSYHHLSEQQARAFRLCSLPGGPDLDLHAAAALLDHTPHDAEDLLEALVDHALLETRRPGRYRYHDLLRLFAQQKAETEDTPDHRDQATGRLLAHYTSTARNAVATISPDSSLPDSLLRLDHPGRSHPTAALATDWMIDRAPHLFAAIDDAVGRNGMLPMAADLLFYTVWLQHAGYDRGQIERVARRVAEAAESEKDDRCEAFARFQLGLLHYNMHDLENAIAELGSAADLAAAVGDRRLVSDARYSQATALRELRMPATAIDAVKPAIEISRQLGDTAEEAQGLAILARAHLEQGDIDQALVTIEHCSRIARQVGDPGFMGYANYVRGVILREAGRLDEATADLMDALVIFRTIEQTITQTYLLYHLAETRLRARDHESAAAYAGQCLGLSRDLGSDFGVGRAHAVLGKVHLARGDRERARAELHAAHEILQNLNAPEAGDIRPLLEDLESEAR